MKVKWTFKNSKFKIFLKTKDLDFQETAYQVAFAAFCLILFDLPFMLDFLVNSKTLDNDVMCW